MHCVKISLLALYPTSKCEVYGRALKRAESWWSGWQFIEDLLLRYLWLPQLEAAKSSGRMDQCIKGESNPRRVDGNDPGYHYPINASTREQYTLSIHVYPQQVFVHVVQQLLILTRINTILDTMSSERTRCLARHSSSVHL